MKGLWELLKTYGKTVLFFAIIVTACVYGLSSQLTRTDEESKKVLEDSLYRATVQCYAIESRYPPNLEYLETNYGVKIDKDKFHVFYVRDFENSMPDITVNPAN